MAHCRVLLCNINKKSGCQDGGFLSISNKDLVTFHFSLAIYPFFMRESFLPVIVIAKIGILSHKLAVCHALFVTVFLYQLG